MLTLSEFKDSIDKFFMPLVIGRPVFDGKNVVDFEILYVNEAFTKKFNDLAKEGMFFTGFKDGLSFEMPWAKTVENVLQQNSTISHTFYSKKYSCWLSVTMNSITGNLIAFSILDISTEKDREETLKQQNQRLANLTEELSKSQESLKNELDKIASLNEELKFIAYHDTLTKLNNKQQLFEDMETARMEAAKDDTKFGIIMMDLDNMKFINDSRGHAAGDQLICNAAEILKRFEPNGLKSYRFGGDEFVVLAEKLSSRDTLLNIGDVILETFNADGIEFSGGLAVYPDDSLECGELLKFSDMAMFEAKKNARNNLCFFQNPMQEKFLDRLNIQGRISDALVNNEFQLYYQPQFDVATNKLRGFEALLRWHDEMLGWINPERFISIAEETKLVIPLGDWVMDTALKTLSEWVKNYGFDGIMSVNVSPIQLKKPDFLFNLKEKIKKYNINTKHLEIEITEGVMIDNKEEVIKLLNQIRAMGIGISLDDFGTGYSSLNYLQVLPITTLKIDKSFIANITSKDGVEANITDSIVSMVTKMGLDTIAEGVEYPEQLKILKNINCKTIQGFLTAKPMSLDRCNAMLSGDTSAILTINNDTEPQE